MPISIFRAGETITPGNIVAVTQNSVVKKASVNDPETFRAIGVATTSGYAGDAVKVVVDDQVHIFSGLTPGSQLYLSPTPGLYTTSYTTITSGVGLSLNGSANLSPFAWVISASGITLQTPAAVVADVSSESITLEDTPINNIFGFLTEYDFDVVKESGLSSVRDPDAARYIAAVEAADGQSLENPVRTAIDNFIIGCKQDGIWSAIKASCILAGARTLNGALVPLVGTAPTNNGPFVAGDYNRKTGLAGDGSTKYLNSNRAGNAETQNNVHRGLYLSSSGGSGAFTGTSRGNGGANAGWDVISGTGGTWSIASRSFLVNDLTTISSPTNPGFAGTSRSGSASYSYRLSGAVGSVTYTSSGFGANQANSVIVFGNRSNGTIANFSNARLAFYSIGESLDLALLDARVTALINAFAAAIP